MSGLLVLGAVHVMPAQAHSFHHCHHGKAMMKKMMMHGAPIPFYLLNQDRLGLSKNQVKQLVALKIEFRKKAIAEKAQIKILHLDIKEHMMQRNVDTGTVEKDLDKILAHKKVIAGSYIHMVAGAHKVLTSDQFEQSKKLMRAMFRHHMMMMH